MNALSKTTVSRFAKLTAGKDNESNETTVYGTIKERNGSKYVLIDGAEVLTPVTTTVELKDGDRVTVLLKNHTATVTGNVTSPSRNSSVGDLEEAVKDQALVIDNNTIHRGTTAPKDPEPGKTVWIDFSVDPPLLKRYTTDGKWEAVGTDKVQTSYVSIRNNRIDIKSGGLLVIDTGAGVSIKSGGSFTVEADNLTINEDGVITASKAELKDATVNGTLLANGFPVLHTGNIIINSSAPANPRVGMVWINPNSAVQTEQYIAASSGVVNLFSSNKIGKLQGDPISAPSGTCQYTIKVPIYSTVTSGVYYIRVVVENTNYLCIFPTQVYSSSGLQWYEQTLTLNYWLGETNGLNVWIEISRTTEFPDESMPSDLFQFMKEYPVTLTMICTPTDVSGWQNAEVKYFAG